MGEMGEICFVVNLPCMPLRTGACHTFQVPRPFHHKRDDVHSLARWLVGSLALASSEPRLVLLEGRGGGDLRHILARILFTPYNYTYEFA